MMKKIYLKNLIILITLIISVSGFAQNAGISATGAVPPNSSAGLDVNFSNKGILIPRVALTSTTSNLPLDASVAGMLVYNTETINDVTPGFYFSNGSSWIKGLPEATSAGDIQYWDGAHWVSIAVGSQNQVLQINPSGIPEWVNTSLATLTTTTVTGITSTSAYSGGSISGDGGSPISEFGICWAVTSNPTVADNKTSDGTGFLNFSSSIIGLSSGTTYYVRAYATNSTGTAYGSEEVFSTP
jgi:hypothetical protein